MTRLSHSSKEMYLLCSEKWRLHYQEKLRSMFIGSPLFIGSAMDEAFSRILLEKKVNLTEEEKRMMMKSEFQIFDECFTYIEYNREKVYLPKYRFATYFASDFNEDILSDEDVDSINEFADELDFCLDEFEFFDFMEACKNSIRAKKGLDEDEQKLYNYINWLSLRRKCHILLDGYREEVLPLIHEVYSIQEKVELKDGNDTFIGYIDFTASFNDEPNMLYVCDNKTASRAYKEDSVKESSQLAGYCEYKETNKAAYIVIEKKLRKRKPVWKIKVIKDEIPEETFEDTFNDLTNVLDGIHNDKFEKNFDNCYSFGQKCPYYEMCRGEESKGLIKKEG